MTKTTEPVTVTCSWYFGENLPFRQSKGVIMLHKNISKVWNSLTGYGKEAVKLIATLIAFVVVLGVTVCNARAAENGTAPGEDVEKERRGPICGMWEQVRVGEDEGPEVEAITILGVSIWNSLLPGKMLDYSGRWPLYHMSYKKDLPHKERPHSIAIRTADSDVQEAWVEEGSPYRMGLTQRRFNFYRRCTVGSLIWLKIRCVMRYPPPHQNDCHSPGYYLKVVLHELGHALGLPESDAEGSVMFPSISENDTRIWFGEDTREILNRYYSAGL